MKPFNFNLKQYSVTINSIQITLAELRKMVEGSAEDYNFLWQFCEELSHVEEGAVYVSEYGAYDLGLNSKFLIGDSFQIWLAEEVMPSIREEGERKLKELLEHKGKEIEAMEQLIKLREKVLELYEKLSYYDETKLVFTTEYYSLRTDYTKLYKATKK